MSNTERSFWAGLVLMLAASVIYFVRGLPGGWDILWHGGMFALAGMLMAPKVWPTVVHMTIATLRDVFGKSRMTP